MLKAVNLRCEYQINPIDLFVRNPRFSWILESDSTDVIQSYYELQVSEDGSFSEVMWKKEEASKNSIHILYEGPELIPAVRYYWRVRIKDCRGNQSPWSEATFFESAYLYQNDLKGAFISGETEKGRDSSGAFLFRKGFRVNGRLKSARLYASAKGIYEPYCNGQRVGEIFLTPGWTEYHRRLLYQTYDVTQNINQGNNAIGLMAGPGWYKGDLAGWAGRRNVYGTCTAIWAQLRLEYQDGRIEWIVTDESWLCSHSPIVFSELYHGEKYDARLEQKNWCSESFDDTLWRPPYIESKDVSKLHPQDGPPVVIHKELSPVALLTTPKGETVLDFGQNLSGWVRFTVIGQKGERVRLRHGEVLDAQGNFYTDNLRSAQQKIEYILKGGKKEEYAPHFTFQGFRYVCVDEYPGEIELKNFKAQAISSRLRQTGFFKCSNPLLNQLIQNIRWGMRDNFVDIPTDCPQRDERLGWTGDVQVFVGAASYLMETAPFFRKWLRDLAVSQWPDGAVPHVVPDVLQNLSKSDDKIRKDAGAAGWGDAAVVVPWTMAQRFGDLELLRESYPAMKKWIEYIRKNSQEGVLWNSGFHFGDWLALDAEEGSYFGSTPNDLIATAYYARSVQMLTEAAEMIGNEKDVQSYAALYQDIKKAYQKQFFTLEGELKADTQTAHVLSLAFHLTPEKWIKKILDRLVELLAENNNHLTTGFLGTPHICQALSETGCLDLAYSLLLLEDYPSWLYQVKMGATTVWEHWDGLKPNGEMWSPDMNSFNHYAYGAVADWVFSSICGMVPVFSDCGVQEMILKPEPGKKLDWAEGLYDSQYGRYRVYWERKDAKIKLEITIPHNTCGILYLPSMPLEPQGIIFEQTKKGVKARLGSGNYCFCY